MSISPANKHSLPTLDKLGVSAPSEVDAEEVATQWLQTFEKYISSNDIDGILSLLTEDAWWRDLLAMTWDFRSFQGQDQIRQFLTDRLAGAELKNFKPTLNNLESPYDDLTWIRVHFTFDSRVGGGSGVLRLVPTKGKGGQTDWKAHSVFTNLESLNGHHEKIGPLRNFEPNHGKWLEQRRREMEYADYDPEVLIVGGGQSGLEVAARLKHTGISALVIEKQARIGDQWRHRYAALCLHDVVWYDHMPYIPFPESWPVYTPAQKLIRMDQLADWLESYARNMEIDYWTSTTVTHARQEENGKWAVTVRRNDKDRVFHVDHVVFAIGVGGGTPNMPTIPGMDKANQGVVFVQEIFKGQILHSTQHKKATDHAGKKVVVVGACTSGGKLTILFIAHDIAADYADHGVDVTLYQRSATYIMTTKEGMPRLMKGTYWEGGPPTNIADMIDNSMPILYRKMLHTRITKDIAEADHALLEGLKQRGFNLSSGVDDSGFLILALMRLGGYYLDVGASQMIIDGKIKLKSGSPIKNFTETGLEAEDGSNLPADVVLFATGYGDARNPIREIVGEELGKKLKPIWGLDEEGELRSVWRDSGLPNLWVMMGKSQ
ncbi:hypothetical protein PHLCEN_2v1455 [Hermanssonia centrifuga]|uniref:Flavin-containing monooxygenase n=1 Tax=Hermanssonia centrifuga TaxID=98765 RepID=A0A2R6RZX3_9APHY|nr:hypothetical protein PHLCEN_2v1455 [Hermanssonia centrifuga]